MGRDYELIVALPASYAANPDRRYPVLYVTDAHYAVPLIRSIVSYVRNGGRDVEDHILVGLGYAVGETRQFSRRRDYTPSPNGDVDAVSDMPGRAVAYGGAEPYRRHVRDEVFPFIDRCYRTDPARRIFAGHSYGGLFGSHVLLTEPEMFQRYIIMSPSLWYDRRLLLARERGYAMTNRDMKAEVLMLIGSEETSPTPDTEPFADAKHDMTGDQAKFVAALRSRNYPGLILEAAELPGEDHNSVYPMAVTRGLKWALKPAD
jgi:predicted alpha/beta superfamily hydrolase